MGYRRYVSLIAGFGFVAAPPLARAQGPRTPLRLNVFDAPYNLEQGIDPLSMDQTLALVQSTYGVIHWGLGAVLPINEQSWRGFFSRLAVGGADVMMMYLPLGGSWLHEEWHRAVMAHRGVSSYNDVNDFPIGAEVIAVSQETDESLAAMKANHPKDFIRMSAAGMESSHALVVSLNKNTFFRGAETFDRALMWIEELNPVFYMATCASKDSDDSTRRQEELEGTSIRKRDFIGLDCNGWVYDLHRPDEPFEARGTHPSGVGIRRYRSHKDLSDEERSYLRTQATLSWINLLNPFLFGFDEFPMTSPTTGRALGWNVGLGHDLLPFGYALSVRGFFKSKDIETPQGTQGLFVCYYHYINKSRGFPGLEIEHRPLPLGDTQMALGARVMVWQQPKNLDFVQTAGAFGGLLSLRAYSNHFAAASPYLEYTGKTDGWVVGEVSLESAHAVRLGVEAVL